MDNAALAWILFYIAAALMGIFLTLVYLVSKKSTKR
jgi:hypothetical protein